MIQDQETIFPEVIVKLLESEHEFYPTGDRYFGLQGKKGEYHFFTQAKNEILDFLDSNGFEYIDAKLDTNTAHLMRFSTSDGQLSFQIEAVRSIDLKKRAQRILKETEFLKITGSPVSSWVIWNLVYATLQSESHEG